MSFALASFTPEAFFYWLPAFLEVAIIDPEEGWSVSESLLFRFQSLESEQWQTERFTKLCNEQLKVVKDYFELEENDYCGEWMLRVSKSSIEIQLFHI